VLVCKAALLLPVAAQPLNRAAPQNKAKGVNVCFIIVISYRISGSRGYLNRFNG
jgi:hypothetical protein